MLLESQKLGETPVQDGVRPMGLSMNRFTQPYCVPQLLNSGQTRPMDRRTDLSSGQACGSGGRVWRAVR